MILIHEAGQGKMYLTSTRNHKPQPAMGHAMQTGSTKQTGIGKWAGNATRSDSAAARGFTLLELMIVITIISILVGIAAGAYVKSVQRAKEATLKSGLTVLRQAIDHYTLDKEAAPPSLEEFTNPQSQYLRETPKYP